jgi:hypothetical protein
MSSRFLSGCAFITLLPLLMTGAAFCQSASFVAPTSANELVRAVVANELKVHSPISPGRRGARIHVRLASACCRNLSRGADQTARTFGQTLIILVVAAAASTSVRPV